jgi:hypothetical protein
LFAAFFWADREITRSFRKKLKDSMEYASNLDSIATACFLAFQQSFHLLLPPLPDSSLLAVRNIAIDPSVLACLLETVETIMVTLFFGQVRTSRVIESQIASVSVSWSQYCRPIACCENDNVT